MNSLPPLKLGHFHINTYYLASLEKFKIWEHLATFIYGSKIVQSQGQAAAQFQQ
jgi:hypothetical protein